MTREYPLRAAVGMEEQGGGDGEDGEGEQQMSPYQPWPRKTDPFFLLLSSHILKQVLEGRGSGLFFSPEVGAGRADLSACPSSQANPQASAHPRQQWAL